MKRPTKDELAIQLERIEALIRGHPEGISLASLVVVQEDATGWDLPKRTMSRRISALVRDGRVRVEGSARATRYFPLPAQVSPGSETTHFDPTELTGDTPFIPLSTKGKAHRARLRQPLGARRPVGYDEGFLRGYEPGVSWYLPEAMRRKLHDQGRTPDPHRPAGTFARDIFERLLIDLAWASSRLEGNTYSRLDTKNLLEYGVRPEGKGAEEAQMVLNHKKAIELLVEGAEEVEFNRHTFLNLHGALAENLLDDPKDEGRIRDRIVQITGTTYVPLSIPQKLDELFDLFLKRARGIPDPFEQAFFTMVHLPYFQPFADVNKRTSRLGANLPLIKANLCPLSFVGVPEQAYVDGTLAVYELTRIELLRDLFMWAYERSCEQFRVVREALGEPDPIRLRYRPLLAEAIRDTVCGLEVPRLSDLEGWAEANGVPIEDRRAFAEVALGQLVDLHEGAISRYGIRLSEYQRWRLGLPGAD